MYKQQHDALLYLLEATRLRREVLYGGSTGLFRGSLQEATKKDFLIDLSLSLNSSFSLERQALGCC
jgi:hypothetical protein